ncbi:Peptidase C19, ubiquitin carboxyl-terminal hydrolase [Dillenia turbinata]|uniref:ubiquitinyl hydrolase 1 n=1 Tax=Dillenia turbinata TaxID=194707 RepID=A0AAN8V5B7_9MAGN
MLGHQKEAMIKMRPTTRGSKNKRHKPDNNGEVTSDILRKIHSSGIVTKDDINQLFMIWKPVCQGCRVNSKDNPNCFCALVPPLNGSRKSGLWQKMSDILLALGPDPSKDLRASPETPAGLTNLGATCYANSILQCLYMNKSFREGIFSVEPDLLQQNPVLDQLARLFAQLHNSIMAFIDSAPFIKTLELDNGVQQDSHEFLTLLLSLLEQNLNHSKISRARTVVQDLFRGSVSHVTRNIAQKLEKRLFPVDRSSILGFIVGRRFKPDPEKHKEDNFWDAYWLKPEYVLDLVPFPQEAKFGRFMKKCSKCGKDSEASSNMEDFYELELNIKGLKTLEESLDDYLNVEELHGDNQYYCESCGTRVDATRRIMLRSLPHVLNFQLKRCIFHSKTTMKKKITSVFCFPQVLEMGQRLSEPSQSKLMYDLSAVLIHKGSTVNSGHYVAHIKDDNTSQWWEFDDEQVSNLGPHPFGEGSSNSNSKSPENEPVSGVCTSAQMKSDVNSNHSNADLSQSSGLDSGTQKERYSSGDAYMLMYTLRIDRLAREKAHVSSGPCGIERDLEQQNEFFPLPSHLSKEIEESNKVFLEACKHYKLNKESEVEHISERRQEVRSVLSDAPVLSHEEPYFWISADWLRQWADSISPPLLDNTSIQCSHEKVSVSKVGSMKRLSTKAWTMLVSKYDGGPALSENDYCTECLIDGANSKASADGCRVQRAQMKVLAEAVLAGNPLDGTLYYVSKPWLQQWIRRKHTVSPCDADGGPTATIRCPHGGLLPEQAAGAKRVLVPESLWLYFYESATAANGDDSLGCSTFPEDSEPCFQCSEELTEVASFEDTLKAFKLKERKNHEKLALGKSTALNPQCRYYLLPSSWLSKWRSYINASGKQVSSAVKPEALDSVIDSLKCQKHLRLLERPLELTCKRGMIFQKLSSTDGLTLVTENDWKSFCEEWGGSREKCISAEIEYGRCSMNGSAGSFKEVPNTVEQLSANDDANDELESRQPIIKTCPESAQRCAKIALGRESCELVQKLNYTDEDICVCFVRGKEAPKSLLEASRNNSEPDRRTSKRSRKTAFGNSINLKVSGSMSIYQLKMMIWESFGVVKENQIIHKGSSIIDGESATLADMNIFPGDLLWVTDSEIHEYRDIADELSNQKSEAQQVEEGFRGTLLASNISSQVI